MRHDASRHSAPHRHSSASASAPKANEPMHPRTRAATPPAMRSGARSTARAALSALTTQLRHPRSARGASGHSARSASLDESLRARDRPPLSRVVRRSSTPSCCRHAATCAVRPQQRRTISRSISISCSSCSGSASR